ncbi:MAG: neutral/alkaline non-lysosomal ceramidase N-terminal domain-containing protein [Planctomycetes bacterium]|nr:neutral/alkaline non-lysosomal ceramidase N-terminal domain-containing protein [Planctomycetota bacterium]
MLKTLLALLFLAAPAAAELQAGFAKVDITPDKPVPLAGYGARRGRLSTGVHDKVWARAAVFDDGHRRSAILSLDTVGVTAEVRDLLVKGPLAEIEVPPENFLLCATHNHSGPGGLSKNVLIRVAAGNFDQELFDGMLKQLGQALRDANAAMAPAKLGVGRARFEGLSRNRAVEGGPTDPDGLVIKVTDGDDRVRAVFVNFAAHATILGSENMEISSEWPGAMCRALENSHEGSVPFFLNGAEGDQSPHAPEGATDWERIEKMGQAVADVAEAALAEIETTDSVDVRGVLATPALPPSSFRGDWPTRTPVQIFWIGRAALFCFPGEPCVAIGAMAKSLLRREPQIFPAVVACANDHLGYFVPRSYYFAGGYESTLCFFGPDIQGWFARQFQHLLRPGSRFPPPAAATPSEPHDRFKSVVCAGSPREIGLAHGTALRLEIREHSKFWRGQLTAMGNALPVRQFLPLPDDVDPGPLLYPLVAVRARLLLRQCEPDLIAEMEGIAEGAGVSFDEIVFLNTWLAVADQTDPTALFRLKPGCATAAGGNFLGHNADWPPTRGFPDVGALLVIRPQRGRAVAIMTFAGCVGGPTAMNADRVAAAVDSLPAPDDTSLEGLPVWLALRTALQNNTIAADVAEALELSPGTAGYLVTLKDPAETIRLQLSADHAERNPGKPRAAPKHDRKRRSAVEEFLGATPAPKAADLRALLGDRDRKVLAPYTRHSVVMSVKSGTWWIVAGPGADVEPGAYERLGVGRLLDGK